MAEQHGGYRQPNNPAPVSGPGALSRRTDGGPGATQPQQVLPNAAYGEAQDFHDIQAGADMAGSPVPGPTAIPLGAPTQRPDEPLTAGSPMGPGVGPTGAGIDMRSIEQQDAAALQQWMPLMEWLSNQPDASPSTRMIVRRLKGAL